MSQSQGEQMARLSLPIRRRTLRIGVLAVLVAGAVLAAGARCIENVRVYVDDDGYTHIAGEMYNETDIQGTSIMLRGTLLDAAGNVIAQKDSPICPPDSQPGAQSSVRKQPVEARFEIQTYVARTTPIPAAKGATPPAGE